MPAQSGKRTESLSEMRIIATIPTFNEAENIAELVRGLRERDVEVLVADDDSPDGTAKIVGEMSQNDPGIHLLLRKEKKGRGLAGAEAFSKALEMKAERIVEMDADLSHRPEDLPGLLAALDRGAQVVIGSRFVGKGRDARPSVIRRFLTRFSTAYARCVLGVHVRDCNSGFRAFTRDAMEIIEPGTLVSVGPSIVHEVLMRAHRRGLRIAEVPILFTDRTRGKSELSLGRLLGGFIQVLKIRRRARTGRLWRSDG